MDAQRVYRQWLCLSQLVRKTQESKIGLAAELQGTPVTEEQVLQRAQRVLPERVGSDGQRQWRVTILGPQPSSCD